MKKFIKIILWSVICFILLAGGLLGGFVYKIKNGFPVTYETEVPAITFPTDQKKVLLFSKTTGFRHGESIEAGKKEFAQMARENNWFLYETEEGGAFNRDQLAHFDVVIFNNSTGRVLNQEQQSALENYVAQGGNLIGIHGSGDNSHEHWPWYEQNFIGARFSHHALNPQLQEAEIIMTEQPDSLLTKGLPTMWKHTDEWYVFFENPKEKGFTVLYNINGEKIKPDGNLLWIKDKDFGMGKDHPVAWFRKTGNGLTFYTSIGHNADAWRQPAFVQMLENVINELAK